MIALWILAGIIALWAVFFLAPSIILYRSVFARRSLAEPDANNLASSTLAPFAGRIVADADYLRSVPSERITLRSPDGTLLAADYRRRVGEKIAVFFHGYNTHPMKNFAVHMRLFYERGYDLLTVYERGHGESGGDHNCLGLLARRDVPLWVEKASELCPGRPVVIYGMSMGASAAAYALPELDASKVPVAVIDCGFTSPYVQLRNSCRRMHLPGWGLMPLLTAFAKAFMKCDLRDSTTDALARSSIPAFFLHGDADQTVLLSEGQANYNACAGEKRMLIVPGAPHTAALIAGGEEAQSALFDFIKKHINDK